MRHILVIDDDPQLRSLLLRALSEPGHEVRAAAGGREALQEMRGWHVDVVITDLLMPEMDGIETMAVIKRNYPDVRIVAMSGGGVVRSAEYLRLAKGLGAHRTLQKPFTLASLGAVMAEL
jgi:CheY-like chemotaxis protein